jgi:hypothetical protein
MNYIQVLRQHEAFLPMGEDPQPSIRFSRFDALVTLFHGDKVPEDWQSTIEHFLRKHGYVYLPAEVLARPYTGSTRRRFPDWFSRCFGA